jgi:hypothetical protein
MVGKALISSNWQSGVTMLLTLGTKLFWLTFRVGKAKEFLVASCFFEDCHGNSQVDSMFEILTGWLDE